MPLRYLHLDVFTDTPFEGNQLAVFPDPPRDIAEPVMQRIAAEMNFSESTFVFPPRAGGNVWMRIFTPEAELPMAGHPTIGTTFALAAEGVIKAGHKEFVFELGVGPTPVSLEWKDGRLDFAWMTQPLPSFGTPFDAATLAPAFGIELSDVVQSLPAQAITCGVPFLFVPLVSRDPSTAWRSTVAASPRPAGRPGSTSSPFSSSRPTAAAPAATKQCTAACSRRGSASSRIRRREARADRSDATSFSIACFRKTRRRRS